MTIYHNTVCCRLKLISSVVLKELKGQHLTKKKLKFKNYENKKSCYSPDHRRLPDELLRPYREPRAGSERQPHRVAPTEKKEKHLAN